jgi:uncharacterized protein with von Willebrand factor type A (vWA) domain
VKPGLRSGASSRTPIPGKLPAVESHLVQFARLLRRNGVRVSTTEIGDAVAAAALTGVAERSSLRAALRATLVKRAADVPTFEALFDLHFSALGRSIEAAERSLLDRIREAGLLEGDELEMVIRQLGRAAVAMGPLGQAATAGDPLALHRLLRAAALRIELPLLLEAHGGFAARRLLQAAGGGGLAADQAAAEAALRDSGLDVTKLDVLSGALRQAFEGVERAARALAEAELTLRERARRADALPAPGMAPYAPAELRRVEQAVRRLAERLKARLARRERATRRGALAVRRTLRLNLALGGIPARLCFRGRRRERTDLVILCDVSPSMRHVSRLMLMFLGILHGRARRTRTFIFVSELGEVTEQLRRVQEPAQAAELAVASGVVPLLGNSDYGRALRLFHRHHLAAVTRRTTVIVIGDGRTNYAPPQAWVLDEVRRRARRLLWICPEPRGRWEQGDGEMARYAAACDRVAVVTSLAELEGLAEALLPRP